MPKYTEKCQVEECTYYFARGKHDKRCPVSETACPLFLRAEIAVLKNDAAEYKRIIAKDTAEIERLKTYFEQYRVAADEENARLRTELQQARDNLKQREIYWSARLTKENHLLEEESHLLQEALKGYSVPRNMKAGEWSVWKALPGPVEFLGLGNAALNAGETFDEQKPAPKPSKQKRRLFRLFPTELLEELGKFKKIFVLVSGGIDSTYLWEVISERWPKTSIPVNCYNPFETSKTLVQLSKIPGFLSIKPDHKIDYAQVLKESFQKIPRVQRAIKLHKYEKKMFPCCKIIKHDAFKDNPLFKEEGTVVISGIKAADGKMRGWFLKDLRHGSRPGSPAPGSPTFYWKHKGGQLYCYPFRDYHQRELPGAIRKQLREKYPSLNHSGCSICPVLVVWNLRHAQNYGSSMRYWNKMSGQLMLGGE